MTAQQCTPPQAALVAIDIAKNRHEVLIDPAAESRCWRLSSAKKELSEETGYRADNWLQIFQASSLPGVTDELSTGFVAWGLHAGEPHPDAGEDLVRWRVPFAKAGAPG
jgi:8-oxo-dGTP pyrophosphatase MutT (NUDIX family)